MPEADQAPAATPSVRDVTILLSEIAILLELNGKDAFRSRAYAGAARALEGVDADLPRLAREDRLTTLRGVGQGIASVIREYVLTGRSSAYEELRASTPLGIYDLLRVQGLGAKRIHTLFATLGIDSLDSLEESAQAGKIATLPGFGPKVQATILAGIPFARGSREMRRYPEALEVAVRLLEWLRTLPAVQDVEIAGQLRRRMEVVDRIDLVASSEEPGEVLRAFRDFQGTAAEEVAVDDRSSIRLTDGLVAQLRCVDPSKFVAAMLWETGSPEHVSALAALGARRGARLDREGLTLDGGLVRLQRESDIYTQLGLAYVPPELREGLDELDLAAVRSFDLVEGADLKGTFHCHTTYSDGKATLAEMAAAARDRGWSFLGLGDHSQSAGYAGGLTVQALRGQLAEVRKLNRQYSTDGNPFRIFTGVESDILPDGSLDYPDEVLAKLDYVIGSIHSSFTMDADQMTQRIVRAVTHPSFTILGHPMGRLLLTRAGYGLDMDTVLRAAAENEVIIEINANPHRLDLDWRHVRTAAKMGVLIAINPDAHSVKALDHVGFGVNMARKAGLSARQVLNTWPLEEVADYFAKRKQKRQKGAGE